MPDDPHGKRSLPAPQHPRGLPALDDGPVYIAPALDVRQSKRPTLADSVPPPPAADVPPSSRAQREVHFTLSQPVEERKSSLPPPLPEAAPPDDDASPDSLPPETVDWDRVAERQASGPLPAFLPEAARLSPETETLDAGEREALLRDLAAIGELDGRPDRPAGRPAGPPAGPGAERSVSMRATLARARTLRFRLSLLSCWNAGTPAPRPRPARALHLDLTLDAALLVLLADGAPYRDGEIDPLSAPLAALVRTLRAMRPELPRLALRDRATSAIARITIGGYGASLAQVAKIAGGVPEEGRVIALQTAAAVAVVPHVDEIRLEALHELEKALALPPGCVASAIVEARRAR